MGNLKNPVIVEIIICMYGRNQSSIMLCFEKRYKHLHYYTIRIFVYYVTENNRKTSKIIIILNVF